MEPLMSPEAKRVLDMFNARAERKKETQLLEYSMPSASVLALLPVAKELGIKILIEKLPKEDLVILEVDRKNNLKVYFIQTLCELFRDRYSGKVDMLSFYKQKIDEIIKLIKAA